MKKKIILFLIVCIICLCLVACKNKNDCIEIWSKNDTVFDDVNIEIKEGYFYDRHEKFTVDEDTVGVTIYFSKENSEWD